MNNSTMTALPARQSNIFIGGLVFILILGVLAPRSLAFLAPLYGTCFYFGMAVFKKNWLRIKKQELFLIIGVLALAFLSSVWSPNPEFSLERCIKISLIFLPALLLFSMTRHSQFEIKNLHLYVLAIVQVLMCLFLLSEKMSGHFIIEAVLGRDVPAFKLNRAYVVLALSTLPLLYMINFSTLIKKRKIILNGLIIVTTLAALSVTQSQTAQLSFLTGLFFLFIFPLKNKTPLKALMLGVMIVTVFLPFTIKPLQSLFPENTPESGLIKEASIVQRFEVWGHTTEKIFESPLYGQGIEALRFLKSNERMDNLGGDTILHAHNIILQIWVEFGIIGILLALAMLAYLFKSILKNQNPHNQRLYLTTSMAIICCAMTGYGVWQGWQLGLFVTLCALTLSLARATPEKKI